MEPRIALEGVPSRIGDWTVDESKLIRTRSGTVRAYSHVPVQVKY